MTIVVVEHSDELRCEFGTIAVPMTRQHFRSPQSAPCVHLIEPMPRAILFHWTFVDELNFQPTVFRARTPAIIASRRFDVVTLAVHEIGRTKGCYRNGQDKLRDACRWRYRIHSLRFAEDELVDKRLCLGIKFTAATP